MIHATSEVTLQGDLPNGMADEQAEAKLKESCPTCPSRKTVTKGDAFRQEVSQKTIKSSFSFISFIRIS